MNWISVKDRLPQYRNNVIVCCAGKITIAWYSPADGGKWTILYWDSGLPPTLDEALIIPPVTHWMLPELPND